MDRPPGRAAPVLLGIGLIAIGIAFLVLQQMRLEIGEYGWPFFVIVPGIALITLGMTLPEGRGLVVGGMITTILGLILLYQNTTDHWESAAYAWALAAPTGPGLALILYGALRGQPRLVSQGMWPLAIGLALFGAGFVFFEQLVGISGRQLPIPNWLVPAGLVAAGALFVWRGIAGARGGAKPEAPPAEGPGPEG